MKTLPLPEAVLLVGIFVFVARIAPLRAQPGALDSTFDPKPDGQVSALAIQRDDKLIIGGYFTQIGATSRWQRRCKF